MSNSRSFYQTAYFESAAYDIFILTVTHSPNREDIGAKVLVKQGSIIDFYPEDRAEIWAKVSLENLPQNHLFHDENSGMDIFCEFLVGSKNMIICGGGHVSMPVAKIAKMLGFNVTVIDDRLAFANGERFSEATVICKPFGDALSQLSGGKNDFFVIVTRGHRYDQECLRIIVNKPNAYIGMIGSKNRVRIVKEQLIEEGCNPELLAAVHTPIGLRIAAETPEEIAVSIMAEVIQEKNKTGCHGAIDRELWNYLTGSDRLSEEVLEMPKAMITIITRKGAAPRQVGAKMIITADGTSVGTIGGGCMENEAKQKALIVMNDHNPVVMTIDMTGTEAEDEGMVCGGIASVLIEPII